MNGKMSDTAISASYTFTEKRTFANLSGDINPMHVDAVAARRTQAGEPVIHGMHTVLRCFEVLSEYISFHKKANFISAQFNKPILLFDTVKYSLTKSNDDIIQVKATVGEAIVATFTIGLGVCDAPKDKQNSPDIAVIVEPKNIALHQISGQTGYVCIPATDEEITKHFPKTTACLNLDTVRDLMAMSTLVGMECPGLHSMFGGFSIALQQGTQKDHLNYRVVKADNRFRMIKLEVSGRVISGTINAFVRMPPTDQISLKSIKKKTIPNEFLSQNALIIGGTRGLGEVAAKLIAAGGGRSTISYAVGIDDAKRISEEISSSGAICDIVQFDILSNVVEQLNRVKIPPTHLYYFATPKIFRRKTKSFEAETFSLFNMFYVNGFFEICQWASSQSVEEIKVFFPSTTALDQRPHGITEYAMSKAAGEELCRDLPKILRNLEITIERLPRILTDQTATISTQQGENPVDILLPIIRKMNC